MRAGPFRVELADAPHIVLSKLAQPLAQFISGISKCVEPGFVIALDCCRIFYAPVNPMRCARKHRTALVRVITNRNYKVKSLSYKLVDRLRAMLRNVYPDFFHYFDSFGPNLSGRYTGAGHFDPIAGNFAQQPFRHLAAG